MRLGTELHFAPLSPATLRRGLPFVVRHVTAGHRVLVHCARGIGRSAVLGLCVLVERGHAPLDALALAKGRRACVSPSPQQFRGWTQWLAAHRDERGHTWPIPTFDELKAIAYRHLA
jgi:protein-tyrosine phosphatase